MLSVETLLETAQDRLSRATTVAEVSRPTAPLKALWSRRHDGSNEGNGEPHGESSDGSSRSTAPRARASGRRELTSFYRR
jgi:hypothetical protein